MSICRERTEGDAYLGYPRRIVYLKCDHEGCSATSPVVDRENYANGPLGTGSVQAVGAALELANEAGWVTNLMHSFRGPTLHFCPTCAPKHTIAEGEKLVTIRVLEDE